MDEEDGVQETKMDMDSNITINYNDHLNRVTNRHTAFMSKFSKKFNLFQAYDKIVNEVISKVPKLEVVETPECKTETEGSADVAQLDNINNPVVSSLEKQHTINDLNNTFGDIGMNNDDVKQQKNIMPKPCLEDDVEDLTNKVGSFAKWS